MSIEPQLRYVTCASPKGLHRMAYWQWDARSGNPNKASTVLCVHGLTRNGRDFDALAERLSENHRVVCPDIVGRGRSGRLIDPMLYMIPQYVADCVTLIARLDVERVDWVGTSMGGLIGMMLAALPGNPIARLVLNDVGPYIDPDGLARIAAYVGDDPTFDSFEQGEATLRRLMKDFGPHTDEQFRLLSRHYVLKNKGEKWGYHYDPSIAVPFRAASGAPQPDLWPLWDMIQAPTLVLRGEHSDVLAQDVADKMASRGPRPRIVPIAGVGHAPTLIAADQIAAVESFIDEATNA